MCRVSRDLQPHWWPKPRYSPGTDIADNARRWRLLLYSQWIAVPAEDGTSCQHRKLRPCGVQSPTIWPSTARVRITQCGLHRVQQPCLIAPGLRVSDCLQRCGLHWMPPCKGSSLSSEYPTRAARPAWSAAHGTGFVNDLAGFVTQLEGVHQAGVSRHQPPRTLQRRLQI